MAAKRKPAPASPRMTVDEVRARVQAIRELAHDDEGAHGREDDLWRDVIKAIADGHPDAATLAREALVTRSIDFARWCA